MNGFSDADPGTVMSDPRCGGANPFLCIVRPPAPELQLETACKEDLRRQDVPKVLQLRGMRLLGCFGCSKPSADNATGWEHMPHDILVAVVRAAGPGEARAMHLVCKAWHTAVRCGLRELTPRAKQCCFEGIRCFFPRVTGLRLRGFCLGERDVALLGGLVRLQHLQLDGVAFDGRCLITKLSSLQGLRQLEMSNVVGAYPAEGDAFLKHLSSLSRLRLRNDSPAAKLPPMQSLSELRGLQELCLTEHLHLMLPGLTNLSALEDLCQLSLTKVGVTNGVLRCAGALTRLQSLHIPDAFRVTDAGLRHLASLTGLTHLDFCSASHRRDEDITNTGVSALTGLTNLRSLNLAGHCEVTAEAVAFLADCTALTSLDLSGMPLGSTGGVGFLAGLVQLRSLSMQRTQLPTTELQHLSGLIALTSLSLSWCAVDDEAAGALSALTKVAELDVRYCPLTNCSLGRLSRAMPHLSTFAIEGCPATSLGVWRILSRHRNIKLWLPEQDKMSRFMNVSDALLLASIAPGQRRLRVALHPEPSWPLTALVSTGVVSFFLAYTAVLVLFFMALFMFPIFMLGCIFVALCLAALGARYAMRSIRTVWCRCDCAFSAFLLGQLAPPNPHHHV